MDADLETVGDCRSEVMDLVTLLLDVLVLDLPSCDLLRLEETETDAPSRDSDVDSEPFSADSVADSLLVKESESDPEMPSCDGEAVADETIEISVVVL